MKKLVIFLAVLFVSVMSSACINNFAIQELNIKAKEYLDKGDYDEAIKRLESSVDLDGSIFETRYNLAVAYINKEEYAKAANQLSEAAALNPSNPDVYYTLGVAYEGEADSKLIKKVQDDSFESTTENSEKEDGTFGSGIFLNAKDAEFAVIKLDEAIKAYQKYLEMTKKTDDIEKVQEHIKELEEDKAAYIKEAEAALETDDSNAIQGD